MRKPSAEQAAWVIQKVHEAMKLKCSFRYLYQNIMGYRPEEYERFYKAGGMALTNAFFSMPDNTNKEVSS